MNSVTYDSEIVIRLGLFIGFFLALAIAESLWPMRKTTPYKWQRWLTNLELSAVNTVMVRLIIPVAGVAAAVWAQEREVGLFNLVAWPEWLEFLLFILVFDLTIYWQHRLYHALQWLWRLHRVHHTDEGYDLTTGNRFHPLSILLSALVKSGLTICLGASVTAVLVAELLLNLTSMFNHSNVRLPAAVDRALRLVLVTPDMHRIHHSVTAEEHNRNFGFSLSCWDRLFGTYLQDPACQRETMPTGLAGFEGDGTRRFVPLMRQPFNRD